MATVQDRPRAGQQTTTTSLATVPKVLAPFVKQWNLDRTQVDLIKATCCPAGTDDNQMGLFFHECARRGVHPMDRLLIMTLFKADDGDDSGNTTNAAGKKPVFITTIDLHRAQAQDATDYAGSDEPIYGPDQKLQVKEYEGKGPNRKLKSSKDIIVPAWASVNVYKMVHGVRTKFVGKARWSEFYPGASRGSMWHKMPFNQLGKCAEAQALRKAFPRKLGRLYIREEMEQAGVVADAKPAGRGRTKAAEVETHAVAPDPIGAAADVTDAQELATPPADRWIVVDLIAGNKKNKPNEPIWKLVAENGDRQQEDFYTDQKAMAETLARFKAQSTVFTILSKRQGRVANLEEIAPVG